ncbi:glycosyltransferase family 2 protein [Laribacter hongkongensis]|uniref:Glycosyltransferase family 2 protein n=1 Tax=Laribacter hongkongensis TaxID=168471 RepID=A0ABD4SVM0_9NEIS|nr:glycosyltransferase family 2 protein [Laribacter hongkongensis]MCG9027092.1 glycosyltransferase family 2 protein [Laribacter hongkongensis]MCG9100169.1 glycosyltransferase family 2 protein [Laribacter hongkongensis]MCG9105019.1 glycosyltransferase family 2 protein [Laribacter hongkongensis]MCG9112136.1 glycosyltransferase family 2 protein [Laribacter hongkongensis]MCG9119023.1 glycosyltransferase family 2 protein [Laribacter hongkongensis]
MNLSIIIVTYNSARLIGALLDHLHADMAALDAEVIVVDNASRDDTAGLIQREYPWVRLIASQVNLGFAAGNNLAALHARGRFFLLLNPDAMPAPGALARGLALMAQHPQVGLAGGELRGTDGSRQPSARMFPTLRDELFTLSGLAGRYPSSRLFARLDRRWADPEQVAQVDWIPGAFVFIPAALWQQLGGFDERFFMYYEEVDLCRRMQAAGYQVMYWPELKAMHIGGESARTVQQARVSKAGSQLESWRMRSGLLYYRKHHGLLGAQGLHWIEWGWHRLRQIKARWSRQPDKAADMALHCAQLDAAWRDTLGGTHSPCRPW